MRRRITGRSRARRGVMGLGLWPDNDQIDVRPGSATTAHRSPPPLPRRSRSGRPMTGDRSTAGARPTTLARRSHMSRGRARTTRAAIASRSTTRPPKPGAYPERSHDRPWEFRSGVSRMPDRASAAATSRSACRGWTSARTATSASSSITPARIAAITPAARRSTSSRRPTSAHRRSGRHLGVAA